jgi:hypothetical protein
VAAAQLRSSAIDITDFSCVGDVITATIRSQIPPALKLPLLPGSVMNGLLDIRATISASNRIG